jgi:uncharacterized protein YjiS (DUF1127 family)
MSQSYSIRNPVPAGSYAATGQTLLSRWTSKIALWLDLRQGRQDLSELDDRLLADVGISREDALWEAGKPFWQTEAGPRKTGKPWEGPSLAGLERAIGPVQRS